MATSPVLNRTRFLHALAGETQWDVVVIGGGATGLGIAIDSASRGYKTLLLEQSDFAKGTSSRSTKLVHGGVRYLAQGDVRLVNEALRERGLLLKNAPHLVRRQAFIIPCYTLFSKLKLLVGLKLYDWLSGRSTFGGSRLLNRTAVEAAFPGLKKNGLSGGVSYYDGQFDDARLAINLAQTAAEYGAVLLNYVRVTALLKEKAKITGLEAVDVETGTTYTVQAKVVVNATGVFVDDIIRMDEPNKRPLVRPSQGVHVVIHSDFLPGEKALMIPETADGRVLFAVPWYNRLLVGTTDTPLNEKSLEPVALAQEVDFILNTLALYLNRAPGRPDVQSVFAGLRPLAAPQDGSDTTREISRSHKIIVNKSGLLSITGGKWTTYRKMAEDVVDKAIQLGGFTSTRCLTEEIRIHGAGGAESNGSVYGTDDAAIKMLAKEKPSLGHRLLPDFPYTEAEVVWAARAEMARTVEDVVARRLRLLFLDAKGAITVAPKVASLLAAELGFDKAWEIKQVNAFRHLAHAYTILPGANNNYETLPEVSNLNT